MQLGEKMKSKKWLLFGMLAVLVCGVHAADNLLERAKITVNTFSDKIDLLKDNKIETGWQTEASVHATGVVTINFEEITDFNAIAVWGLNLADVEVETSKDGETWTALSKLDSPQAPTFVGKYFPDGVATAWLRFKIKGGEKRLSIIVRELKIYNIDGAPSKALFKVVKEEEGISLNWRTPASYYVDGNTATRSHHWTGFVGSTVTLDLLEETEIKQVVLLSMNGFDSVKVMTSKDGKTYEEAGVIAVLGKEQKLDITPVKARYIQFVTTGKFSSNLNEIRVF